MHYKESEESKICHVKLVVIPLIANANSKTEPGQLQVMTAIINKNVQSIN